MSNPNKLKALQMQEMLEVMAIEYFNKLLTELDDMEESIIRFDKSEDRPALFDKMFRDIHSIKGTSGTYGASIMTKICHQFETHFTTLQPNFDTANSAFVDQCIVYIDLLKGVCVKLINNDKDFSNEENILAEYNTQPSGTIRLLIVDPSKVNTKLYLSSLPEPKFNITSHIDGMMALQTLLSSNFDIVLTSTSIGILTGPALLSACKLCLPSPPRTILTTSQQDRFNDCPYIDDICPRGLPALSLLNSQ